jgi:dCTP diphosphatase
MDAWSQTMKDINILLENLRKFNEERDWEKYHNHKDLAISLALEAAEVLEHFQWKTGDEINSYAEQHKQDIADELSDVLKYLLQLADNLEVDIVDAAIHKLERDAQKYPVDKIKGNYKKYNQI